VASQRTPATEPRLGLHVSIAGGAPRAVVRALERGCTAFQIFCDNPRGWRMRNRSSEEGRAFRAAREEAGLEPLVVHGCYLLNPAASDAAMRERTVARMARELEESARLGAEFYVLHPGSHKGRPAAWGVNRAASTIWRAAQRAGRSPRILLETTATPHGPGGRMETLGSLAGKLAEAGVEVGVALDSCHLFAAGYDLRRPAEVERLMEDLESEAAQGQVCLIHLNDSRDPPGSGRDRHWHLGEGQIGPCGLGNLVRHPRLRGIPIILETPWESAQVDVRNLEVARAIMRGAEG